MVILEGFIMNKILNYIKNGRGYGLKFLILYSLLLSVIFAFQIKGLGDDFVPEMQNAADKILPIKIENGAIIEPNNEIKSVNLNFGGIIFPFVLDTTVDTIDPIGLKPGIYVTRKALYSVSDKDTRVVDFQQNMDLLQGNYVSLFKKVVWAVTIITALIGWFIPFLGYALCAILYAFCGKLVAKCKKMPINFATAMRLSVVCYFATLLLLLVLGLFGLWLSFGLISLAVILLEYLVLSAMTSESKPKTIHKI